LAGLAAGVPSAGAAPAPPVTPASVLASAPPTAWTLVDPQDLMVMDLQGGGRVVIQLAGAFAPAHVANIRAMVRAGFYDGLIVERVQDNYVVQWGDPANTRALPPGVLRSPPAEYERPAAGLPLDALPYRDTYADTVGFAAGFPTAESDGKAWLVHCYGMVGVGRDLPPDTGTGAELYAVIGQAPRALDRNIAVVGRVLDGMDVLAALPRGSGKLGFYTEPAQRLPIRQVRIAADLPPADRPSYALLEGSDAFHEWIRARANRRDDFFLRPAGAVDICNVLPPVRAITTKPAR
jgi:peptidylprolyl isomerase